jgi:diguanylate cyclase (GGDEF)-like protein
MPLDLDGFKEINDRHGHNGGDAVLVRTAHALKDRLRTSDFVARLGGDEFAVILPHADASAAEIVAEELLTTLGDLEGGSVGASCGIALYTPDTTDVDWILAEADRAMYRAKAEGRNRVCVSA